MKAMSNRALTILLVVSVAANFALFGFVVGKQSRPYPTFDPTRGYVRWLQTLPEDRRDELRPIVRQSKGGTRPIRLGRIHREFRDLLNDDSIDEEKLTEVLNRLRLGHHTQQKASHEAFIAFVGQLTTQERLDLAATLASRPAHPRPRRRP
jgi:uncharacterized membrane protein